ncbi:MAG: hypothetical protein LBC93_06875 [Synergistaceae bacterium]|jgi:hypothetical protein|nr:hypothetical protein [Synergistaceae bacterium]
MAGRTEMSGAFIDFDEGGRVDWGCNPEMFSDGGNADFAEHSIPGMSGPKLQFSCGGARLLDFTLRLHYGMEKDVDAAVKLLRSWLYGDYSGGKFIKAPHRILVSFGSSWPNEKWVMRSVNVTSRLYDKNLSCLAADVSVSLQEYIETSRGRKEIIA